LFPHQATIANLEREIKLDKEKTKTKKRTKRKNIKKNITAIDSIKLLRSGKQGQIDTCA
jgi:hypothetical protein